jgi:AcrR family transcriptional regulator
MLDVSPSDAATSSGARPDATSAFQQARRTFMAGERVDMKVLSSQLGVDRSTLFRWVGNRDRLLVDILTSLADPTLRDLAESVTETGGRRVARIAASYAQTLIDTPYYRAFLQREPEKSLRLITTKASPLQQHIVETYERLLQQECDRGRLTHPMRLHDLAYLVVRIMESFIYADIITGDDPDSTKVEAAVAALLHVDLP